MILKLQKSVKSSRAEPSADSKPSLFEEYMKKRQGAPAQTTAPAAPSFGGKPAQDAGDLPDAGWSGDKKAHTRDPVSTRLDPNDPKSKQTYVP